MLESKVDASFHEHELIMNRLDATNTKLDDTNAHLEVVVRRQDRNDVYVKILWPVVTVLSSVLAFFTGVKFF